jgi:ribosome-binding protein aMBF1 (putative translation factor)
MSKLSGRKAVTLEGMNMTSDNDIMEDVFTFENDDEKLQFEAEMIHLDIMNEVRMLMNLHGVNKTELAKRLKTSKGYVTQLFSGDKLINLKTIAKIQQIFDVRLTKKFVKKSNADKVAENAASYHE